MIDSKVSRNENSLEIIFGQKRAKKHTIDVKDVCINYHCVQNVFVKFLYV